MTGAVFVDTNVFVYARDTSHHEKHSLAVEWIDRTWREQSGRTSMQVLAELHVTLTRKLRPGVPAAEAWEDVESLLAWDPQPVDRELLLRARDIEARYRTSWWDAMIVAAAQLQDCELLLSEDLQDGMSFGPVEVVSPFRLRANDARARYVAETGLAPRHRPRGRPRKPTASRSAQ